MLNKVKALLERDPLQACTIRHRDRDVLPDFDWLSWSWRWSRSLVLIIGFRSSETNMMTILTTHTTSPHLMALAALSLSQNALIMARRPEATFSMLSILLRGYE